ncbi:MAG: HEAT repeat domain-containing protein [Symploca sp. SIO2E6]|nr:HEAT repeat domain-containing protein [Symploca sp. SIO2E6]
MIDQTQELDQTEAFEDTNSSQLATGIIDQTQELDQTEAFEDTESSQLATGIIDQTQELDQTEALENTESSQLATGIIDQTEELDQTKALEDTESSQLATEIIDQTEELDQTKTPEHPESSQLATGTIDQIEPSKQEYHQNGYNHSAVAVSPPNSSHSDLSHSEVNSHHSSHSSSNLPTPVKPPTAEENLPLETTTRLAKINIVDELIKDLQQPNPQKRRKAIWELARQGDSRAVKPLVDLMIDSDSQQRSLILEALSQIGNKTLKPLNRALALSLQDDNAQVRKNAIRDLTRVYEVVAQMSQMLCHAADDPDPEVKETAKWAINQLSRIRIPPTFDK